MNKFVHYGFVLLAIASICAAGLSFANKQTSPVIAEMIAKKKWKLEHKCLQLQKNLLLMKK